MSAIKTVRRGDIAIFPRVRARDNVLAWILGAIIGHQFWGWHMGIVHSANPVSILEAREGGVQVNPHNLKDEGIRTYHWFDRRVHRYSLDSFIEECRDYPYDSLYSGEILLSMIAARLTNYRWRIVDSRLCCWELVASFCRYCGKPINPIMEYPLLPKMEKKLEVKK